MAGGLFSDITTSLKNVYTSKVVEPMVNEETPFRSAISKNHPGGGVVKEGILKFLANLNPPQNVGQFADGGTMPPVKNRDDQQFQLTPTLFGGAVQVGYITKAAGNSGKSAFNGGEVSRRMEEVISNTAKFIESTYTSTHGTGRRARVESDGSNTFVASLPEGTRLLRENYYISVRTTDGGATVRDSADLRKITDVNHSTRTVTYDGADQTLVAGDHVHVVTETTQTLTSVFANGLRGLIDDGTYLGTIHGLSRTTYPKLKANVFSNGGTLRNLTEQLLIRACHEIRARSGKRITDIWTSEGQIEKYIEFVAPDRRMVVTGKSDIQGMATGYKGDELVHYAPGIAAKINLSFDMVPRELFLLNWSTIFHYVAKELGWMDEGDMLWPEPASGAYKASFLGYIASVENIGCDMPIANGVIRDLRDPSIGD